MTKRIFLAILLATVAVLFLSSVLLSAIFYEDYETQFFDELRSEARILAQALDSGAELSDFGGLSEQLRITHIAANGEVLYDSHADETSMENHLDRAEIAGALKNGAGQDVRDSSTLAEKTLYYACRLSDGTVLRLSGTRASVFGVFLRAMKPVIAVLVAAVVLAAVLAYRFSMRVVRPLNALDLEHPESSQCYDELSPLLEKIAAQNRQIALQMQELRRRQEEFSAVTDHMSEGLLIIDRRARVLFGNASARRLLQAESVEGKDLLEVNRSAAFRETVDAALRGEHSTELLELGGRVYQLLANPVYEDETLTGAVLLLPDVTEREARERLRREFTANVSHELRTPLTSISGFAELIREGIAKPEDVPRFADNICREAQRLLTLIEDILRLSRLDEGGGDEAKTLQQLDALATAVTERLRPVAALRNVEMTLDVQPCRVWGVRQILEELIFNLCDNAVKYNCEGGSVTVRVREEKGKSTLCVSDTGIGIAPEEQARVFERFYRVDKSHSKEIGGTGLGLSIVKHAAAFHHAELTLESTPGRGTAVTVRFPAYSAENE